MPLDVKKFKLQQWLPILAVLAIAYSFYYIMISIPNFEFDTDEGLNLIKGFMTLKGYALYSQTYSDQPPVLTYILVWVFRLFGPTVEVGRMVIIAFSGLLLWAAYKIQEQENDMFVGMFTVFLIVVMPQYLKYSISVMVGLPAIAMALTGCVGLFKWKKTHNKWYLVVSALLFGIAIMIKGFVLVMVPAIAFLLYERDKFKGSSFYALKWWLLAVTAVVVIVFILGVGWTNLDQLLFSHLSASKARGFKDAVLVDRIKGSWFILLLSFIGFAYAIRQRKTYAWFFFTWEVFAFVVFLFHRPVWAHHVTLISVPAAILSGEVICLLSDYVKKYRIKPLRIKTICWPIATLLLLAAHVSFGWRATAFARNSARRFGTQVNDWKVVKTIVESGLSETDIIITDRPIYAFRAGRAVPPHLAVISAKRRWSMGFDDRKLMDEIRAHNPKLVVFGRYSWKKARRELRTMYSEYQIDDKKFIYSRP